MSSGPGSAHDELRNLLQRYARAADGRDVDGLRRLFHPDAEIDGSRGVMGLEAWLETMAGPSPFGASMHVLGDPLIEMDAAGAGLDTYAVVYMIGRGEGGPADMTLGIRYLDRAAQVGDGWVITRRQARTVWSR